MSYLGNQPATGENNSFKILDDIASYTLTFNGSSASVVSITNDTITQNNHRFITGQRVTYTSGGGSAIGGLVSGSVYYIIKNDQNTIKLTTSLANALSGIAINITALGTGTSHTLNVAFDSINTKFKATYDNGNKAQITRSAQLTISLNNVIQRPQDSTTPSTGFGVDLDSVIVFATAPSVSDVFWGNVLANNFPTFDISDNVTDTFTGTGSLSTFTLSKIPANNQSVLVTLDGVVQYPSDSTTIRSYNIAGNVLSFVSPPGNGVEIQARHIGFAGATSSNVTGFYGRTGNVGLNTSDNIVVNSIGIGTTNPTSRLHVVGDVLITGVTTATDFNSTSDLKLKTNIQAIESPLSKVMQLNGVSFNWKENDKPSLGVIAQDVEKILPELVGNGETKTVNYNGLVGLLIECIKEQQYEINMLKEKL